MSDLSKYEICMTFKWKLAVNAGLHSNNYNNKTDLILVALKKSPH